MVEEVTNFKNEAEEIVLNEMALQGYKVRWYNKVGVISEYLEDGLTINAFGLIQKNPMGYAMLFNHQLKYKKDLNIIRQLVVYKLYDIQRKNYQIYFEKREE